MREEYPEIGALVSPLWRTRIPDIDFRQKLYSYYYLIVVGSSGSAFLFDRFKEDGLFLAQKHQGRISIYDYMSDVRDKEYYRLHKSTLIPWDFDILFAGT